MKWFSSSLRKADDEGGMQNRVVNYVTHVSNDENSVQPSSCRINEDLFDWFENFEM